MSKINHSLKITRPIFKIIIVGDEKTGKSALVRQYIHNTFLEKYDQTIGVDFSYKTVDETEVLLWDISGKEINGAITSLYYRNALAACIVFDVTSASSLTSVTKWKKDIDEKITLPNGDKLPVILLANKCDLDDTIETLDSFCYRHGLVGWFKTTATDPTGINNAISYLIHNYRPPPEYVKHQKEYFVKDRSCDCVIL